MSEEKLKHCPFCGSSASSQKGYRDSWFITCDSKKCKATVMSETKEEAIRSWNRRVEE